VRDQRLLGALREVPRADFVPPELVEQAYVDEPLPIPHGQVTTQPSLVAKMVEALALVGGERVLEIGTGYGFQTALLSRMASAVWSVERWDDIAEVARGNLASFGATNVEVAVGDGSEGLPAHSPYDAIIVSAAYPDVPRPLVEQLDDNGLLVQPIGVGGREKVCLFSNDGERLRMLDAITRAHFVRLKGRYGFEEE
jgi:protein-L-isoaspartate(D-aspartate) O-methyltransferase